MADASSEAFTVSVPEVRSYRFVQRLPRLLLFGSWLVVGYALFVPGERPNWPAMVIPGFFLAISVGLSIYGSRKEKDLVAVINDRFAEAFTARTGFEYPRDVNVLEVQRSIAVRKADGSAVVWGVKKGKEGFSVSMAS
jgi:hypothetical protein